jgi:hypothetical protein
MEQLQFTARESRTSNTAVTWSATAGTISSSGFFTAPQVASVTHVIITATSSTRRAREDGPDIGAPDSASATVTIIPPAASLAITSSALPAASASIPYSSLLSAIGGVAPYQWSLVTGGLPSGIQLQLSSGVIRGVTAVPGSYPLSVEVTDAAGHSASAAFRLTVMAPPVASLAITNSALPAAATNTRYSTSLSAMGGVAPYQWGLVTGALPSGMQLQRSSGVITGLTATPGSYPLSVQVTDAAGHIAAGAFSLTVIGPTSASLAIASSGLPSADASVPYTASLAASGGVTPYRWSLVTGALPPGIQLQTSGGFITGTTTRTGSYPISIRVTDASGHNATEAFSLTVSSGSTPSSSGFDGPAELPRSYIQSAMSNTPAPGKTITVNTGGDLQSALNGASCGDTIQLESGATFTGIFTFPAKSCDGNNWITVRTSADDSKLPAEGSRLMPCYAGVSSLPGRPAFQCAATNNVLAKLVIATSASGPIIFAPGANYYRLIGLEVTRAVFPGPVYSLIQFKGPADHVVFDRLWVHGTAQDETAHGLGLAGTYIAVVDSFFTDFHCISGTGSCTDAQAIGGGGGNDPMGPYKIVDNFLEASGENILFGGGAATATPADIEIRQNHLFKPLTWMKGQAGYVGGTNGNPFIVKNLLELKNAQRVLVEGNIMENSWGGFSQSGFAILLTPKNQAGGNGSNLCPICQVTDVTIRYNSIRHVGGGLQIANALSDNGGAPLDGQRYSIHDIVIDDIDAVKYKGSGMLAQVSTSAGAPVLQNLTINHVTAFPSRTLLNIGNMVARSGPMENFVFTNNIVSVGTYPVWSTGGGPGNCAYFDKPLTTFNACFSSYSFASNALIGSPSAFPATLWPSRNFLPATASAVRFVNHNGGNGGDYHLQPSSPYKGKGTDGRDLGADVDAVASATVQ